MTALAVLLGALVGLGIFMIVAGMFGFGAPAVHRVRPQRTVKADQVLLRVALAIGLGLVAAVITRWPVGAIAAAGAGLAIPSLARSGKSRATALQRTEAVAAWTEMLRDTMAAAAGLNEAIIASARVAPGAIRAEVRSLAVRLEHQPLTEALRRFASDLDDPVADAVVVALILSTERQAAGLGAVLTQIAANAREQAAMRQRVEASRARTYASVRFVVIVTLGFAVGLILLAPEYLQPFGTVEGQLTLLAVCGLFGAAGWGLHRLGQPTEMARLLVDSEAVR